MARRRFLGGAGSSVRRRKAERGGDGALGFWGGGGDWNGAQEVGDGLKKGKPGISGGVLARGLAGDLGRRSRRGGAARAAVAEGRGRTDRWGQAISGGGALCGREASGRRQACGVGRAELGRGSLRGPRWQAERGWRVGPRKGVVGCGFGLCAGFWAGFPFYQLFYFFSYF